MAVEHSPYEPLRFRSQFLLGPRSELERLAGWQRLTIHGTWHIGAHPALRAVTRRRHGLELVLLGTVLDPDSVDDTDDVILDRLLEPGGRATEIPRRCARLGGRWIMVVCDDTDSILFADALGLRQAVYTSPDQPKRWVASQAGLLQRLSEFRYDAVNDAVLGNAAEVATMEYWWPGDRTPLEGVRRLLPNHYLDLANHHVHRFWPFEEAKVSAVGSAVESCASLLRGLVDAASRRFEASVSVTAGLDSRIVLAASRNSAARLHFHTRQKHTEPADSADIQVAGALLQSLNLPHDVVRPKPSPIEGFRRVYFDNVLFAHMKWCPNAEAAWDRYRLSYVLVTGHGAEVGRCYYPRNTSYGRHSVNARELASLAGQRPTDEVLEALNQWLASVGDARGYDLLDLFYWEQRMGQWLAMNLLKWDSACKDTIPTFNCRQLLETMLSVPSSLRRRPHYHFFHTLLVDLWSGALAQPINPQNQPLNPQKTSSIRSRIRRATKRNWKLVRARWFER